MQELFDVSFHAFPQETTKPEIFDLIATLQANNQHLQWFGDLLRNREPGIDVRVENRDKNMRNRMKLGKPPRAVQ